MLTGRVTGLRAIEKTDLPALLEWRNNPEFRKYFREFRELSSSDQLSWYETVNRRESTSRMFAIVDRSTGILLGACGLCYIDSFNRSADLSIYLGHNDLYIDGDLAPDAAKAVLKYGFDELNLHRVWAEVYDFDDRKRKFFRDLGFAVDGRFRQSRWNQGSWADSIFFSLLEQDFRAASAGFTGRLRNEKAKNSKADRQAMERRKDSGPRRRTKSQ